ncbi:NAD(P)/FAD-dependent oxidoreductase [Alcaligenes ammonioxydans]|uniref:phytoene desaturase family protein n=1 Tax=Alcaligenes TaxID=507 RepID=UPI001F0510C2|nr:NAD(P)/FAD-dependent oxidoreductase [Alcaligenes ammonioxydans]MCH1880455.1 NAD(P)/FAD-dependent oxidoreductase [Alcaligenes ammonioxydans]HRK86985.1 NAD(P)/FAD-dependent oxidoreductase [Alcaligenes faecalis]
MTDSTNNKSYAVIVVGSGINSLVCAALLAQKGKQVLVLERNDRAGGCIRTEELFPGFTHELLSSWYPLFTSGAAYARLKDDLAAQGVEFLENGYTTGVVGSDGKGMALRHDVGDSIQRINALQAGDGDAFGAMCSQLFERDAGLTFGLLGTEPYSRGLLGLLFSQWRKRRMDGMVQYGRESLESFRRWADRELKDDRVRGMMAPWVLHSGLGPDDACSALIGKLTFAAVVAGGMPVVKGGGQNLVRALCAIIEKAGGRIQLNTEVEEIVLEGQKARGVRAGGQVYEASHVVCNVTPPQLYGRLLPGAPAQVRKQANAYRFGRGDMQIHLALDSMPNWSDPELLKVPLLHLSDSLEDVSMSVAQANNGLIPARFTVAIGQPCAVDPSRAPQGKWILWMQMQDMPSKLRGDAAGKIDVPEDGKWSEEVSKAVAERIIDQLEGVMPGLRQQIVGQKVLSPADLESINCNLVGGDPYSGICSPDQFFWMRPFAASNGARSHATPYKNVYHIGASTHPGPGLAGASGFMVAEQIR